MFHRSLSRQLSPVCCLTASRLSRDLNCRRGERRLEIRKITGIRKPIVQLCVFHVPPLSCLTESKMHPHLSHMAYLMHCASGWDCSSRENKNASFTFTKVSVPAKQISFTLELKSRFRALASQPNSNSFIKGQGFPKTVNQQEELHKTPPNTKISVLSSLECTCCIRTNTIFYN